MNVLERHADGDDILDDEDGDVLRVQVPHDHPDDEHGHVDDEVIYDLEDELGASGERVESEAASRKDEYTDGREDVVETGSGQHDLVHVSGCDDLGLLHQDPEELGGVEDIHAHAPDDALDEFVLTWFGAEVVVDDDEEIVDDARYGDGGLERVRTEEIDLVQLQHDAVRQGVQDADLGRE